MLAEDLERLAVDDVVVEAGGALPAGEGGVDDDLVAGLESGRALTDCIDDPCSVGTTGVRQVLRRRQAP